MEEGDKHSFEQISKEDLKRYEEYTEEKEFNNVAYREGEWRSLYPLFHEYCEEFKRSKSYEYTFVCDEETFIKSFVETFFDKEDFIKDFILPEDYFK
jgi:hypothetical protein